jgi:hypothetical protein
MCRQQEESVQHLFSMCDYTITVEQELIQQYGQRIVIPTSFTHDILHELIKQKDKHNRKDCTMYIIKCFVIGKISLMSS